MSRLVPQYAVSGLCAPGQPRLAGDRLDKLFGVFSRLAQRLQRAVGFRNVLVHEYTEVDRNIVMQVLRTGTRDLADFGKAVLALPEARFRAAQAAVLTRGNFPSGGRREFRPRGVHPSA